MTRFFLNEMKKPGRKPLTTIDRWIDNSFDNRHSPVERLLFLHHTVARPERGTVSQEFFFPSCRAHEQDLGKRHERELGEISMVHHRETQIMLSDFNKAQEGLKDKISALQIL